MTTIKHHLNDALLMGYSAGNLPEAFNLVVATHISLCDECRARLGSFDAIGGTIVQAAEPVKMQDDSLAATLAMLMERKSDVVPLPRRTGIFPSPLQSYVNGDLPDVQWRKIGGGVSQMVIPTGDAATVRLLKIPAGTAVPDHGHGGIELTLVLQGAFRDHHDRFGTGDIEIADEDVHHIPVAEEGLDCICLSATDAPLRFKGLLPRIAGKFVGI